MTNPVVVITGASRGIGKAIALKFASNGFNLFLGGTNSESLERLKQEICSNYNIHVDYFAADLSQEQGCKSFTSAVLYTYQKIDVLINNAGVFLGGKMMEEDSSQLEKMMNTNLYSAYWVTKFLWSSFKNEKRSHIFNMCSIASFTAYQAGGSYSISKFALLGFSKSLRLEGIERGIRVTSVMPGATLTDSWAGIDLPESRFMKAEDVAESVFAAYTINEHSVMEEMIIRPILGDI